MAEATNDARLNFRINGELKKTIEAAATQMGQTVSDFAIATLIQASRKILLMSKSRALRSKTGNSSLGCLMMNRQSRTQHL